MIADSATSPSTAIDTVSDIANTSFRAFAIGALAVLKRIHGEQARGYARLVRIPVAAPFDGPLRLPDLGAPPAAARCSVRSPWADIAVSEAGVFATLLWNERQLLVDLSDPGGASPPAPREPHTAAAFDEAAQRYGEALMNATAGSELRLGLPVDLAALFARAPASTLAPFEAGARGEMQRIAAQSVPGQLDVIERLLALCGPGQTGEYEITRLSDVPYPTR
jgi:hypothetical protein